jgi:hypothetical protein
VNNSDLVLVEWVQHGAWASEFRPPKRVPGDTDIVKYKAGKSLQDAKLVKIKGPASDASVVAQVSVVLDGGNDGSVSPDDTLSPYEG